MVGFGSRWRFPLNDARRPGRPLRALDRATVVRAARQAFARGGYPGATLDLIANHLGIRKASLLHHFPSKDLLYAEAVVSLVDDLERVLVQAIAEGGFAERLDRLSLGLTAYLAEHPEAASLLLHELGGPRQTGAGLPPADRALGALQVAVAFLQYGIDTGALPPQDAVALTLSIVGLHLVWFAVPAVTAPLVGNDPFLPGPAAERAEIVRIQVRRLCGLPE